VKTPQEARDLLHAPLDELLRAAGRLRDEHHHDRITFSPKVFIPLTMLCRDRCGYCTFAKPPARLDHPYLPLDEVLAIARAGAALGCHEALFTLGEGPEDRYPVARWLTEHGYSRPSLPRRRLRAVIEARSPPPRQRGCAQPVGLRRLGRSARRRG
jgi:FO synthase